MTTVRYHSDEPELDDLYEQMSEKDLQPLWAMKGLLTPEPAARTRAHRWSAKQMRALGERAGELVPIDRGGDRRVLACANPGLNGLPYATSTLWAAVQFLGPREMAPAHRHSPSALRFVLEGDSVWTMINGDPLHMAAGDLILTPAWTFHEHHNPSDRGMLWVDVLDLPVVEFLESVFFEEGPSEDVDPKTDPQSASERYYGAPGLIPAGQVEPPAENYSPLLAYRWADTDAALRHQAELTGKTDVSVRFTDPVRGRDVMPTLRCEMRRISAGTETALQRQTGTRVTTVLHGSGRITIGDNEFDIEHGDILAIPSWAWTSVQANPGSENLDLFTTSDAPVLEALKLFREERS
ncbi:cupin domain-containing protein [Paenarthrobacter ureafaciens]|uniref:cupin domain-containing protein n=1 Tax=Paenarthrobacter ureafaciens TaxID=37931 RepID=UPI002DB7C9B9|nr:cupin domain-containing protein [Paenarthrobacter ureafaciens]MEC3853908.1 cupin domain-containing protein [Paenarthrobacter ureafaciens]